MITSAGLRDLINNFNDSLLEQKFDLHKLDTFRKKPYWFSLKQIFESIVRLSYTIEFQVT